MKRWRQGALAVFVIGIAILLGTSSGTAVSDRNAETVSDLVSLRIHTMQAYFNQRCSYSCAKKQLENIEAGEQLSMDLEHMRNFRETDIDRVCDFVIKSIEFTYESEERLCALLCIQWESEGLEKREKFQIWHSAVCEKNDSQNDYKLVHFF